MIQSNPNPSWHHRTTPPPRHRTLTIDAIIALQASSKKDAPVCPQQDCFFQSGKYRTTVYFPNAPKIMAGKAKMQIMAQQTQVRQTIAIACDGDTVP